MRFHCVLDVLSMHFRCGFIVSSMSLRCCFDVGKTDAEGASAQRKLSVRLCLTDQDVRHSLTYEVVPESSEVEGANAQRKGEEQCHRQQLAQGDHGRPL